MIFQFFGDAGCETPSAYKALQRHILTVCDLGVSQSKQELLMLTVKSLLDALVQLGQFLASRRFFMESQVQCFHVVVHVTCPFRFCNTNNYHTFSKKATTIFRREGLLFFGYAVQFLHGLLACN